MINQVRRDIPSDASSFGWATCHSQPLKLQLEHASRSSKARCRRASACLPPTSSVFRLPRVEALKWAASRHRLGTRRSKVAMAVEPKGYGILGSRASAGLRKPSNPCHTPSQGAHDLHGALEKLARCQVTSLLPWLHYPPARLCASEVDLRRPAFLSGCHP